MRAVNLIPADAGRGARRGSGKPQGPAYAIVAVLALALVLVTVYVLTNNTISERKAKLASLQAQVAQAQAEAGRLTSYSQFAKLAQARAQTVREIAAARFDWHGALSDLAKVVPADTSLQSLVGTVVPGADAGGSGAAASGSLRTDITAPAFELSGCTKTQDDVARLMSRLRLINGVTRVTLGDSQKQGGTQAGAAVSTSSGSGQGCGANTPSFDLVVFFAPLPGAGATGVASLSALPVSGTPSASTPPSSGTASSTTAGTPTSTAPTTTSAASTSTSATTTSGGSSTTSSTTSTGGSK